MSRKGTGRRPKTAEDARAETRVRLGSHVAKYQGHTPIVFDGNGEANFRAIVGGFQNRSRAGRSERTREGGLRFVPDRNKPIAVGFQRKDAPAHREPSFPGMLDALSALAGFAVEKVTIRKPARGARGRFVKRGA